MNLKAELKSECGRVKGAKTPSTVTYGKMLTSLGLLAGHKPGVHLQSIIVSVYLDSICLHNYVSAQVDIGNVKVKWIASKERLVVQKERILPYDRSCY